MKATYRWALRTFRGGCAFALLLAIASPSNAQSGWPTAGYDLKNSRYQASENKISPKTVGGLALKWSLNTDGDVTANPAVDGDYLYFPDSAGFLYKVNKNTGGVVWKNPVATYTGIPNDFARATPAISGNTVVLGNQAGKFLGAALGQPSAGTARVFAVEKNTGAPLWNRSRFESDVVHHAFRNHCQWLCICRDCVQRGVGVGVRATRLLELALPR